MSVPDAQAVGGFRGRVDTLSSTLKWLMASAGAIAAALIAGLQLTSLASRALPAALLGAIAVAVALVCVGKVLVGAGRVLAAQSPTATEISNDEIAAGLIKPHPGPPTGPDLSSYPLLGWIQDQRSSLLGNARTVTEIIQDQIVGTESATDTLQRGASTTWRNITRHQTTRPTYPSSKALRPALRPACHA